MIGIWFKLFYRNSIKNWMSTLVNIGGLSLGLLCLLIGLSYYDSEVAYDAWNPHKDHIYKVGHRFSDGQVFDDSTQPEAAKCKELIPEITDALSMPSWYMEDLLQVGERSFFSKKILYAQPNFFEFFPHPIRKGNKDELFATKNSIVIAEEVSEHLFQKSNPIGKALRIGKDTYVVSGVFKQQKASTTLPQVVIWDSVNKNQANNWGAYSQYTYYKIADDAVIANVEEKILQVFIDEYYQKEATQEGIALDAYLERSGSVPFLEKLADYRLHGKGDLGPLEGKGNYLFLMLSISLALLILLISTINFINLSFANGVKRSKEVGVKKVLGLAKKWFYLQYSGEIALQIGIAVVVAFGTAEFVLPLFNDYFGLNVSVITGMLFVKIVGIALLISLLVGILFSGFLGRMETLTALKGKLGSPKSIMVFRNTMLAVQLFFAGFFLIGALIVKSQVNFMNTKELGFSGEGVVVVPMAKGENRWQRYQLAKAEFEKKPYVINVSSSLETPGKDEDNSNNVEYRDALVDCKMNTVDYGHFKMLDIQFVKGNSFSSNTPALTAESIIMNETAISKLGIQAPIGKTVTVFGKQFTIKGVVKDYHFDGFEREIRPVFYLHYSGIDWLKYNLNAVHFKLDLNKVPLALDEITKFWQEELEPGYPFEYRFVDQQFKKTFETYKRQQLFFSVLTIIIISVSLLGLLALSSLVIQQRLKEVAIKKTLGASVRELMADLLLNFVKVVLISTAVLIPVSYWGLNQWLDNFAYRISMPIWPYMLSPLVLLCLVIMVVGFKAYRATKVDLISHLKFE